jgi:hypothetical protein
MSKRDVSTFLGILRSILLDAELFDPSLRKGFQRDIMRLEALCVKNGLHCLTVWFPDVDKVLCRALDDGFLAASNLPLLKHVSKRVRVPRFFGDFG